MKPEAVYASDTPLKPSPGCVADFLEMEYVGKKHWCAPNPPTREEILRDTWPIPAVSNREWYSHDHHLAYWLSGLQDFRRMREMTSLVQPPGRYLDFGGSSGRVARHAVFQEEGWETWLCDFKPSSVEFIRQNFDERLRAITNTASPSLPFPDASFDLISGFSVFTHINELEIPWLLELRRLLRPGGLLYLSIHDESTWSNMEPSLRDTVVQHLPSADPDAPMPSGKMVVTFRTDDPYNCNVFHSRDYIQGVWGRYFRILDIRSSWVGQQAAVVMQRTIPDPAWTVQGEDASTLNSPPIARANNGVAPGKLPMRLELDYLMHQPVERVFAYIADPRNRPDWQRSIREFTMISDGEPRLGMQWRERPLGAPEFLMEITAFETDHLWAERGESPAATGELTIHFAPDGDRTHLHLTIEVDLKGFRKLAAPFIKLIAPFEIRGDLRRAEGRMAESA